MEEQTILDPLVGPLNGVNYIAQYQHPETQEIVDCPVHNDAGSDAAMLLHCQEYTPIEGFVLIGLWRMTPIL